MLLTDLREWKVGSCVRGTKVCVVCVGGNGEKDEEKGEYMEHVWPALCGSSTADFKKSVFLD